MNPVTRCGLIAGAICGEVMVLLVLINIIIIKDYSLTAAASGSIPLIVLWNVVYPLLVITIFEIGGIFAARLCRAYLAGARDAFLTGFIAGVTTGIILEVMWFSNIVSMAVHNTGSDQGTRVAGIVTVILLLIILVLMGGILSAFGSYIYSTRTVPVINRDN
jgi:hypothetical protein